MKWLSRSSTFGVKHRRQVPVGTVRYYLAPMCDERVMMAKHSRHSSASPTGIRELPEAVQLASDKSIAFPNRGREIAGKLYNRRMSESRGTEDLLEMYTQKMGKPLGPFFHHLWQDLARLHLSWNEYVPLFGKNKKRVDDLNKAAHNFFGMVQDMWWNDILLMLWKLTDTDTRTLSILRLSGFVPSAMRSQLNPKIKATVSACKFAHKIRHNLIAHRNAEIAMKSKTVPPSTRAHVRKAIAALDEVFNFVHGTYTGEGPMMWEHLDALGGAESVLWIVRRGLKAREDDFKNGVLPMRFED